MLAGKWCPMTFCSKQKFVFVSYKKSVALSYKPVWDVKCKIKPALKHTKIRKPTPRKAEINTGILNISKYNWLLLHSVLFSSRLEKQNDTCNAPISPLEQLRKTIWPKHTMLSKVLQVPYSIKAAWLIAMTHQEERTRGRPHSIGCHIKGGGMNVEVKWNYVLCGHWEGLREWVEVGHGLCQKRFPEGKKET